jgi:hypothetical protein
MSKDGRSKGESWTVLAYGKEGDTGGTAIYGTIQSVDGPLGRKLKDNSSLRHYYSRRAIKTSQLQLISDQKH